MNKYINSFIEFKCDGNLIAKGILINYSEECTLLRFNPVDYVLDGLVLLSNKSIKKYRVINDLIEYKVLTLKMKQLKDVNWHSMPLHNSQSIFIHFMNQKVIVSIETLDRSFYVGKVLHVDLEKINLQNLNANGEWQNTKEINFNIISQVEFDNDYINSLSLIL